MRRWVRFLALLLLAFALAWAPSAAAMAGPDVRIACGPYGSSGAGTDPPGCSSY